jgi:hypothetical protein
MLGRVFRVLLGFVLACLAAGLTLVLFVYTPLELAKLSAETAGARLGEAGLLALATATQAAVFAAPFALVAALIGEWRALRSPAPYALIGVAIAALGFFVHYRSEAAGELSILNGYALSAFALAGLAAGIVYWLAAGRSAVGLRPTEVVAEQAPLPTAQVDSPAAAELPKA